MVCFWTHYMMWINHEHIIILRLSICRWDFENVILIVPVRHHGTFSAVTKSGCSLINHLHRVKNQGLKAAFRVKSTCLCLRQLMNRTRVFQWTPCDNVGIKEPVIETKSRLLHKATSNVDTAHTTAVAHVTNARDTVIQKRSWAEYVRLVLLPRSTSLWNSSTQYVGHESN